MIEKVTLSHDELQTLLDAEWKKGYGKGNLDGYYGTSESWKEKFPEE